MSKPLRVGVGAIEMVSRLVELELTGFRSLFRFCQESRNLRRTQRTKTASGLEIAEESEANRIR
jgi:hypothetical protein